jgi:hypothetical protein
VWSPHDHPIDHSVDIWSAGELAFAVDALWDRGPGIVLLSRDLGDRQCLATVLSPPSCVLNALEVKGRRATGNFPR